MSQAKHLNLKNHSLAMHVKVKPIKTTTTTLCLYCFNGIGVSVAVLQTLLYKTKPDGLGPVDNRPSYDELQHVVQRNVNLKKKCRPDTPDTCHVTPDTCHLTPET